MPILLPSPQILEIAGADAAAFAHAQFCNDVIGLAVGHWQWNAWLSPQGRVRRFFMLLRDAQDRLRLLLRGGDAQTMRAELERFVFRAKVALRAIDDTQVFGCDEPEAGATLTSVPAGDVLAHGDHSTGLGLPGPDRRWLILQMAPAPAGAALPGDQELNGWRLADIRAGLPEIAPTLQDQLLPQWLALGRLDAINVRKGCYPGQEIMARLHFKGGNKRGLYRIQLRGDVLPAPGTRLLGTTRTPATEVGLTVMAAWTEVGHAEALAVLLADGAAGGLRAETGLLEDIKVVSGFA